MNMGQLLCLCRQLIQVALFGMQRDREGGRTSRRGSEYGDEQQGEAEAVPQEQPAALQQPVEPPAREHRRCLLLI